VKVDALDLERLGTFLKVGIMKTDFCREVLGSSGADGGDFLFEEGGTTVRGGDGGTTDLVTCDGETSNGFGGGGSFLGV